MTKMQIRQQALCLPEQDRLELARELWASIDNPYGMRLDVSLPQWQRDLIDERLEESKSDPGMPWNQVKAEIWSTDS